MLEKSSVFFLGGIILHKGLGTKDFLGGKTSKVAIFWRKKKA